MFFFPLLLPTEFLVHCRGLPAHSRQRLLRRRGEREQGQAFYKRDNVVVIHGLVTRDGLAPLKT